MSGCDNFSLWVGAWDRDNLDDMGKVVIDQQDNEFLYPDYSALFVTGDAGLIGPIPGPIPDGESQPKFQFA